MSALLEASGLTKRFGGVVANDGISFQVQSGEILGIMGPNGAGKSTLFDVLTGFHQPDGGRVVFMGRDITGWRPDTINRLGIARTFQKLRPFADMTTLENVVVAALPRSRGVAMAERIAWQQLSFVGLTEQAHVPARFLSTGQRKRLELARAMATSPRLLLMDEVTGGVDQRTIPGLIDLVRRLRDQGVTLLIIEHNVPVLMDLADRVLALHQGRVLAQGVPADVATNPAVVTAYLGQSFAIGATRALGRRDRDAHGGGE